MGKAVQYYNGTNWQQFGVTTEDITLNSGFVANMFYAIKDSQDNLYIICQIASGEQNKGKVIKISKNGNKASSVLNTIRFGDGVIGTTNNMISIDRSENILFLQANGFAQLYYINISNIGDENITPISCALSGLTTNFKFAIYQDQYIWVASGNTVKIYDYDSKVELASASTTNTVRSLCCSDTNTLYITDSNQQIQKLVFNGVSAITRTYLTVLQEQLAGVKQLLIDRFGDLIILTNTGTASTLLKYTTAGVQVGTTLDLGGAYYNLNTDSDGNYYYSNDLGTYKIAANTAQGQAFTGTGTKIRGSGMVSYGNNITGYNPAVFG